MSIKITKHARSLTVAAIAFLLFCCSCAYSAMPAMAPVWRLTIENVTYDHDSELALKRRIESAMKDYDSQIAEHDILAKSPWNPFGHKKAQQTADRYRNLRNALLASHYEILTHYITCSTCSGAKEIVCIPCNRTGMVICPKCKGEGYIKGGWWDSKCYVCYGKCIIPCANCKGRRMVLCPACNASGKIFQPAKSRPVTDLLDKR